VWWKIVLGIVVVIALLIVISSARAKKAARDAEIARGAALGTWTVYYDVKALRIGLVATFGEGELLRYLVFRAHDLFDYNQGLEAERQRLASSLRAAATGTPDTPWKLLFPPPKSECFHAHESPEGTLFKFFDGTLYEGAVDQPRFIGGDSIAKAEGLVGECVAIAAHLRANPATAQKVATAMELLVSRELAEGVAGRGAKFWAIPRDALRAAGAA
jgi:hypothetical protein